MVLERRKKLLNYSEFHAKKILEDALKKYRAEVGYKIRLRDALRIERSGLDEPCYDYATRAHFDFVVQDHRGYVQFAIEWDGPCHREPERAANDSRKNFVCDALNFPLFRIDSTSLRVSSYKPVLEAIIDCWFQPKIQFDNLNPLDEILRLDAELPRANDLPIGSEQNSGLTAYEALCFFIVTHPDCPTGLNMEPIGPQTLLLQTMENAPCTASSRLLAVGDTSTVVLGTGACRVPGVRGRAAAWLSQVICLENVRSLVFEFM